MKAKKQGVPAPHGEKMIEVKIRFWTDDIAEKGHVVQREAWTSGVVRMEANQTHGIKPLKPKAFNSLMEIPAVIEEVLIQHGIVLYPAKKAKKYLKPMGDNS